MFSEIAVLQLVLAMLIVCIKMAAKNEEVYIQAAIHLVGADGPLKETMKSLEQIGRQTSAMPMLGPIERAEVIRTFAFRNLPIELFAAGIRATEALSVITKCNIQTVSLFVVDFFQSIKPLSDKDATETTDLLYHFVRSTPVPPEEFFTAFEKSRRLIVSGSVGPEEYLEDLRHCLSHGIPVDSVYQEIKSRHES